MSDEIQFVEINAETIEQEMISEFENALKTTLYPGDERRIFLQQEMPVILGLKNNINDSARQNLLRYARGTRLDALGERYDTPRLEAQKAVVTLKWTLSAAQAMPITITKGKRATPDGRLFFTTVQDLVIPAGNTSGTMIAEATIAGEVHNGFMPGQISTIVDPTPFVASVTNIDTSTGGADIEPDDDGVNVWSGYRGRIRLAPTKVSTAGPEDAYIFWAKTASKDIIDVKPISPAAGEVKIVVLMKGGEFPSQAILDAVLAACNHKKRRPLSDKVSAAGPSEISYDLTVTYYIDQENSAKESEIKAAIESSGGAKDQYLLWQRSKLGRSINPDEFRKLALIVGASRLVISAPSYTALEEDQIAIAGSVNITYGGLE